MNTKIVKLLLVLGAFNVLLTAQSMGLILTVTPTTTPVNKNFEKYSTYTTYTKQYYMLRSYIEKLEASGGGTLVLTKGVYTVPAALYVGSNVTISCNDGVTIAKGNKTGTTGLQVSKTLFQFVSRTKSLGVGTVQKYAGEANIKLLGTGTAQIDMKYFDSGIAVVMGNNSTVLIKGITFRNSYAANYIRMSASRDVTIQGNHFINVKPSVDGKNDAIKLCTPDQITSNFAYAWSAQDKTPNLRITIKGNVFDGVERAVGSNVYTAGVYHKSIMLSANTIANTQGDAVRALNWEDVTITGNTIRNVAAGAAGFRGILASGVRNATIMNNTFKVIGRPAQFLPYKNLTSGQSYATTYNTLSAQNLIDMESNTASSYKEGFIRVNQTYNVFDKDTDFIFLKQVPAKDFVLGPASIPFQGMYTQSASYNSATKHYFLLRSHMEALERSGGGTLRLTAGTYVISNVIFIPSNVTILFDSGVVVRKGTEATGADFDTSLTIFECIRPSRAKQIGVYGLHNGERNIHFQGTGNATIDLNYGFEAIAITFGHNTNVSVKDLNFINYFSGHFLEVDACLDVVVSGNDFRDSQTSGKNNNEAINLDTPDKVTLGFTHDWSKYDRTPNTNVTIENNGFYDLDVAVGTHECSQDQYHKNVIIRNNVMQRTRREAIRVLNWDRCFIEGNEISDIPDSASGSQNRGILISGAIYPTIRNNTIENVSRAMQLMPFQDSKTGYDPTYNVLTQTNKTNLQANTYRNITEAFIRINTIFGDFVNGTEKLPITVTY